jgi:N6-adenosine-specific RNA methylase IME4
MSERFLPAVIDERGLPALKGAILRAVEEALSIDDKLDLDAKLEAYQRFIKRQTRSAERVRAAGAAQNLIGQARCVNERLLGELLDGMPKAAGGRPYQSVSTPAETEGVTPTLTDLGLGAKSRAWKLSARAQRLFSIPPTDFSNIIDDLITGDEPVTPMRVLRMWMARQQDDENETLKNLAPALPTGEYQTIVIDPPWEMTKIERDVRPNQVSFDYPTMDYEELAKLAITDLAASDAHLFCWTTHKHLPAALDLVERWGFRYVLTMVWHKSGGFQPVGLPQYNCEFVIYARLGSPKFIDTKAFSCCFAGTRREHSRKPDEFYELIERVTPAPRIDVFSREPRDGFAQHGNEVAKFAS